MLKRGLHIGLLTAACCAAGPVPTCLAEMVVRQSGRTPETNADTLMTLDPGQSLDLTVTVKGKGEVSGLTLAMTASGLDVTDGALSRSVTVAAGKTALKTVTVRGKSLAGYCGSDSRVLRLEMFPRNETGRRVCGKAAVYFACDPSTMAPQSQPVQAVRPDTVWRVGTPSTSPPARQARRDTVAIDSTGLR